ncbi:hypothetical protein C5167_017626 [Papaver somniferum]|uniref:Uncharacterized protein n=1 Tax=Papaver somniferum TaxID=3469 RepID=A0A4Y7IM62_PAPSO|nr:hypothetical protein C5167_017626 [Papaver somniferum]
MLRIAFIIVIGHIAFVAGLELSSGCFCYHRRTFTSSSSSDLSFSPSSSLNLRSSLSGSNLIAASFQQCLHSYNRVGFATAMATQVRLQQHKWTFIHHMYKALGDHHHWTLDSHGKTSDIVFGSLRSRNLDQLRKARQDRHRTVSSSSSQDFESSYGLTSLSLGFCIIVPRIFIVAVLQPWIGRLVEPQPLTATSLSSAIRLAWKLRHWSLNCMYTTSLLISIGRSSGIELSSLHGAASSELKFKSIGVACGVNFDESCFGGSWEHCQFS